MDVKLSVVVTAAAKLVEFNDHADKTRIKLNMKIRIIRRLESWLDFCIIS